MVDGIYSRMRCLVKVDTAKKQEAERTDSEIISTMGLSLSSCNYFLAASLFTACYNLRAHPLEPFNVQCLRIC